MRKKKIKPKNFIMLITVLLLWICTICLSGKARKADRSKSSQQSKPSCGRNMGQSKNENVWTEQ